MKSVWNRKRKALTSTWNRKGGQRNGILSLSIVLSMLVVFFRSLLNVHRTSRFHPIAPSNNWDGGLAIFTTRLILPSLPPILTSSLHDETSSCKPPIIGPYHNNAIVFVSDNVDGTVFFDFLPASSFKILYRMTGGAVMMFFALKNSSSVKRKGSRWVLNGGYRRCQHSGDGGDLSGYEWL